MSYWIEDIEGFVGDFATVQGLADLRAEPDLPPALKEFLDTGLAEAEQVARIIDETKSHPTLNYIARLLRSASPPIVLTDGVIDDADTEDDDEDDVTGLAAPPWPRPAHPTDRIAAARAKALGEVYRGVMAPFREIILASNSPEEALHRLSAAYRDWKPERLAAELETALQICAAAGAAAATRL